MPTSAASQNQHARFIQQADNLSAVSKGPFHAGPNFYTGQLNFHATNLSLKICNPPIGHFRGVYEIVNIYLKGFSPLQLYDSRHVSTNTGEEISQHAGC